ncbi:hypothetical protein V6N11_015160 [Hibiscus sabdariffa]|uniref:Uncharacterized protein n=1 Tax=Hibiscus sabdariffa TaxID=183260 RepID=A0ABR2TR92_9ROSI
MRSKGEPFQEQNVGDPSKVGSESFSRPNKREVLPVVEGRYANRLDDKRCPIVGNLLHKVNIIEATESLSSSGRSKSLEPVFDPDSGLYSIKPKVCKDSRNYEKFTFKSRLDKIQSWVSFSAMRRNKPNQLKGRKKRPDAGAEMGTFPSEFKLHGGSLKKIIRRRVRKGKNAQKLGPRWKFVKTWD